MIDDDDGYELLLGIKYEFEEGYFFFEERFDVDDVFEVDEYGNEVNFFEELD